MELTEDGIVQKYGKKSLHRLRKTLRPYDYEHT